MKRKNSGLSSVEIIIAAAIVVVVVVGILIAVKASRKNNSTSKDAEEATKIADDLMAQVEGFIGSADLDVDSDENNYIRMIGSDTCRFYHFDSASGKVFYTEKASSEFGSDADAIRAQAKAFKPEDGSAREVAKNVKAFTMELLDPDKENGRAKVTVRTQVGNENVPKTKDIPLNAAVIKYYSERAGHPVTSTPTPTPTKAPTNTATPTPTESADPTPTGEAGTPTPEATATPEPTATATPTEAAKPTDTPTPTPTQEVKPTDTPTPTPTPTPVIGKEQWLLENPSNNLGSVATNRVPFADKNSVVRIIVRRTDDDTTYLKGSVIGGIGFDLFQATPPYEFILQHDPAKGEEFYFEYKLQDLKDAAVIAGEAEGRKINKWCFVIKDGSGYSFVGVKLIEP